MQKRKRESSDSSSSMSMGSSLPMSTPPQLCPEAVRVWASAGSKTTRDSGRVPGKARNYLLATGWNFFRAKKSNNYMELRYQSPTGKVFYSLITACQSVIASQSLDSTDVVLEPKTTTLSPIFYMRTRSSRKRRKIHMRSMEDILNDERSLLSSVSDRVLGRKIPVNGRCDLSWTLLKSELKDNKIHNLKLHQALEVMHQCFEPSRDPSTHKDVAEDIIFNGERDFYTVVLEKQDKVVTAANVKIHGVVAEVPLVATGFEFRRQGMCKVLMTEIENWLEDSGIERLVLPSAQSSLKTWTSSSIGFSTMTVDEKADLLIAYDCLDFQDTVMCEKRLVKKNQKGDGASSDGSTISHEEYVCGR